jgi:predicted TIM-barrel fold metal-dependent hydrolase
MARAAIISVDGHVKAPRAAYREYVDPKWRGTFDEWVQGLDGTPDGFVGPDYGEDAQWDPARRVAALEAQGVMAEVLFPNGEPFEGLLDGASDGEQNREANMAFNRWVLDFCSGVPGRLHAQALVSFDDIDRAVEDITWAKEQGFVGILMPGLHPGAKFFFDPALDPIWAACVDTGLPLSQHGGTGAPTYEPSGPAAFMVLAAEHSFYSGRSLWQLILGGVFDRYPDLKIAFVETETWWIAPMMNMLDQRDRMADDWIDFMESMGFGKPYVRRPSDYWLTNCYAGISPFHPMQVVASSLGSAHGDDEEFVLHSDNAMFGVDYPHPESIVPNTIENARLLASMPNVTEADALRVLYENAAEVYHLDLAALQPVLEEVGFDLEAQPPVSR